jgi:superfamily II DNA or RNA helicase
MVPMTRPHKEEELAELVKKIGDVVHIDECVDVPDQVFETRVFKTNKKQEKLMKDISLKETNPVVKFTKFHQIENGSLKGDEYNENVFIEADKHDHILELARENKKLAVFCRYNLQIDSLYSLIQSQLKDKLVYIIRGDVNNRDEIVQAVEKAEDCVILINSACSEGYELPSIGVVVFASLSFSFKDYVQAQGRFLRINALKKNVFIHLINEGSVDEAVFESISNKQDFDLAIYAKNNNIQRR